MIKKIKKLWADYKEWKENIITNPCKKNPKKQCPYEVKVSGNSLRVDPIAIVTCCKCIDQRDRMNESISKLQAGVDYNGTSFSQSVIDGAKQSLKVSRELREAKVKIVKITKEAEMEKSINSGQSVLGFIGYMKDGKRAYSCRGIGEDYDRFYREFIPDTSYKCIGEDWPWDNFIFEDKNDEERFLKEWFEPFDGWFEP